jgi:hypothetical protein
MYDWIFLAGLGSGLAGATLVAAADAWLSRALLVYLDAVEANVGRLVEAVRSGTNQVAATGINLRRDRGQDRARVLKTFGWLALVLGFALQCSACLAKLCF